MSDLNNLFLMEIEGFNVAKDLEEALKITQPQQKAWGSLLKTYNSLWKSKKNQKKPISIMHTHIYNFMKIITYAIRQVWESLCFKRKNSYEILLENTLTHFKIIYSLESLLLCYFASCALILSFSYQKNCIFLSKKLINS